MKKGFKVLGQNMEAIKGNGMIYELYKEYTFNEEIECGKRGYHYFESLRDCMLLYNLKESRVFECEVLGESKNSYSILCTNRIRLTRELSQDEIRKYIEDNLDELINDIKYDVRQEVARYGYGLDRLINDKNWRVRQEVARYGYGLDRLINDKNWCVRYEVARHGFGLDKLVHDVYWAVREEVARHGYSLGKLVNDEIWAVRQEVACHGYGLDKLVNDEDWRVRQEVARHGVFLDKLVNDIYYYVREEAKKQLELQNQSK